MRRAVLLFCSILCATLAARDLGSRPLVLVHGYGPENFAEMKKFRQHLIDDGIPSNMILSVQYDGNAPSEEITATIASQLEKFLTKFPDGTRFDVVGHSMGGFEGLYSPLQSRFGKQLDHYTALAGWTHGQNHLPSACRFFHGCGQTLPMIVPTDSYLLTRFYWDFNEQIHGIKKCSLYSRSDILTDDPLNSGGFLDGINVEVANVRHIQFMNDLDVYHIMRTACYGERAPKRGFKHKWIVH